VGRGWGNVAVRVVAGLILAEAGYRKLFQVGLAGVQGGFAKMAIPLSEVAGPFIAVLELVGGLGVLLGLFGRWWGLLFAIEFTVAAFYVKLPQGWNAMRLDLMLLAAGLLLALDGSGPASLDALWRRAPAAGRAERVPPVREPALR
jgi:putative oxidoreductase